MQPSQGMDSYGWPNKPIWWADIAALSTNPQGWAAYGHPEWGNFKFGHTNPSASDSGLAAVLAENYAAVHKVSNLTLDDINKQETRDFVTNIESSVIHYGDSIDAFADEMFKKGPSYLSAVVMNESLVDKANQGQFGKLPYPVVAIYPKEGTFVSDFPFAALQANRLISDKKNAIQLLHNFLLDTPQQQKALPHYFNPGTSTSSNGPDTFLAGTPTAVPLLFIPPPAPTNGSQNNFNTERNKLAVMLILDHSGSMSNLIDGDSKLAKAKQGLIQFMGLLGDGDNVGLTMFSDQEVVLTPMSQLGPKRQSVTNLVNTITASGNTRLYNTIADQFATLQSSFTKNIKVIIALTDGIDDAKSLSLNELITKITPGGNDQGEGARVYTIAYGNPADVDANALTEIADATGAHEYSGTPQNIQSVYDQILKLTE